VLIKHSYLRFVNTGILSLLLLWSVSNGITSADEVQPGKTVEKPVIDARTDKLLKAMGNYLKSSQQFSFHADITFDEAMPSKQKIQYAASSDVAVHRPDMVYAERNGDLGSKRFWYDGKSMTLMDIELGVYATEAVPDDIDSCMDHLMEKYGFSPPLVDLVYQDPYQILIENAQFGFYAGLHNVVGVRCHHLAFIQKDIDWQIWIEDGKQLVPRKIVITYKNVPESPQFSAVLSEWDLDAHLPDTLFNIDLADTKNLKKIKFMTITDAILDKSISEEQKMNIYKMAYPD